MQREKAEDLLKNAAKAAKMATVRADLDAQITANAMRRVAQSKPTIGKN